MDTEIDTHANRLRVLKAMRKELVFQETHPHTHFDMHHWVDVPTESQEESQVWQQKKRPTLCKTSACIAGTAGVLLAPEQVFVWIEPNQFMPKGYWTVDSEVDWSELGQELLGLDYDTASALFYRENWPWYARENDRSSDLKAAIWLLQEIDNGNLEFTVSVWDHVEFGSSDIYDNED